MQVCHFYDIGTCLSQSLTSARSAHLLFAHEATLVLAEQRQKNTTATHGTVMRRTGRPHVPVRPPAHTMPRPVHYQHGGPLKKLVCLLVAAAIHCLSRSTEQGACVRYSHRWQAVWWRSKAPWAQVQAECAQVLLKVEQETNMASARISVLSLTLSCT
jgi:hypothetical protein